MLALAAMPIAAKAQEGVMARSTVKGDPVAVCGHRAYVTNSDSNTLSVIELAEMKLVANLPTGKAPVNPTFNRDWSKRYLSDVEDGTLSIVDTSGGAITGTIPAGRPHPSGLRFLPDGKRLVISFIGAKTSDAGALGIMDLASGKLGKVIPVQAQSERFDHARRQARLCRQSDGADHLGGRP